MPGREGQPKHVLRGLAEQAGGPSEGALLRHTVSMLRHVVTELPSCKMLDVRQQHVLECVLS